MSIEHEREPQMRLRCPACSGASRVRNSQDLSPSTRRLYMQCMNPRCRCIFESIAEITKVYAPSMLPESEQDPQMLTLRKGKRFAEAGNHSTDDQPNEAEETAK